MGKRTVGKTLCKINFDIWKIYFKFVKIHFMCVVSMVGDDFTNRIGNDDLWKKFVTPYEQQSNQGLHKKMADPLTVNPITLNLGLATQEDLNILRREIEQLKQLLKRALKYDEDNNEPHCETDAKIALIKQIAEALGVDLTEVLKPKNT
jgi:hypothetical protein